MTIMWTNSNQSKKWVQRVRHSLAARGYYYETEFYAGTLEADPVVTAARLLGRLHVPSGANSDRPVILTHPTSSAPQWRPFDRRKPIRWHNDFSTRAGRPEVSLSWIQREDPAGPENGAWLVASATSITAKLCETPEGARLVAELAERAEPFGYRDAGGWRPFRVIIRDVRGISQPALRFYGPALEDGMWLRSGRIPDRTREIVERIEEAADSVREVLPAKTGSLLIVHNSRSLHDRSPQTVTGPVETRRQALLCFVKQLHRPL